MTDEIFIFFATSTADGKRGALTVWESRPSEKTIERRIEYYGAYVKDVAIVHLGLNDDRTAYVILRDDIRSSDAKKNSNSD